jgi:hypothetical protein
MEDLRYQGVHRKPQLLSCAFKNAKMKELSALEEELQTHLEQSTDTNAPTATPIGSNFRQEKKPTETHASRLAGTNSKVHANREP